MKILTIIHYDDMPQAQVSALVEIPEGKTEDEVFLAWIQKARNKPNLTMQEVNDNDGFLYHWQSYNLTQL